MNTETDSSSPSEMTTDVAHAILALTKAIEAYGEQADISATEHVLAAARELGKLLPYANPETGVMPWEIIEFDDPYQDERAEGLPGWCSSAAWVINYVISLNNTDATIFRKASAFEQLWNEVGSMVSWHPDYDEDRGEIVTPS